MRQALAVLTAGLVFGGLVAANAQNNPLNFPTNVYYMSQSAPAGTAAPYVTYGVSGGVPAGALLSLSNVNPSSCTFSWYGMRGWSTVQGSTNLPNWVNVTTVEATNYSTSTTVANPFGGASASFRVVQNNSYVGVSTCAGCHPDKYNLWTNALHSIAYNDPWATNNFSLACRTIGYGQPTGFTNATQTPYLENVGCENCHGPAGWHGRGERDLITPAVSLDPAICGSCHQGPLHPTYQEWTNVLTATTANLPMGVFKGGVGHSTGDEPAQGCSPCHSANNRAAIIKEYYDRLAGNPHPVTLFSTNKYTNPNGVVSTDAKAFGAATCATCHDPHGSTNVAQLRYPTWSTNWYCVPTVTDPTPVLTTNANGTVTTNALSAMAYNTIFDSFYNPKIQVCGQCHSSRGNNRWDGTAYGLITNNIYTTNVTYSGYVPVITSVTNLEVVTNSSYGSVWTNGGYILVTNLTITTITNITPYVTNQVWVNGTTTIVTNPAIAMGVYYPLIPYTNSGTTYYSTNSAGDAQPHYAVQYNVLIGQLDYDYATNANVGIPIQIHSHGSSNPNQCITCHTPSYAVNGSTNDTGHTFVRDNYGCMASCHSTYTSAALDAKVINTKTTITNSISRVVSLLNQWATNLAPAILQTNYGPMSWEYPGAPRAEVLGTSAGLFKAGPPAAWNGLNGQPSFTNDNLQLKYVPQDIRIARFSLYMIYKDQSLGVHNPDYVKSLLADAETRVLNQFKTNSYAASFGANVVQGFAGLTVQFTNYGSAISYSWNFGDGGTTTGANPTYTYNTPGLYSVTCIADGKPLTRSRYIWVLAQPIVSFTADQTNVAAGTTVNFSNTSSNTNDVYLWRWYPVYNTNSSLSYYTSGGGFSFTYTNAGTYSVRLRASCPTGTVTNTVVNYITVTNIVGP